MRKHITNFWSLMLAVLLVFSLITPGLAQGTEEQNVLHEKSINPMTKMSNRLVEQWDDEEEKVTFLVKFKEKADTEKAVKKVLNNAQTNLLSAQKAELQQRSAVVHALKETATTEQKHVLALLGKEEANGNVEVVRSYFIVNTMAVTATKEVAEKIASFPEVEKLLPNETRYLITPAINMEERTTSENAPSYVLDDIEWNVDRVNAPDVWERGYDGSGTVVASIDTGVEWDHPALKAKYRGYNETTGEVDHDFNWFDATEGIAEPFDDQGHGTHVTGTMVGSESDGTNQIGVAPGAKWIGVKAFAPDGTATDADLLAAAEWILAPQDQEGNIRVDLTPDIVNNSWGGGPGLNEWYRDVVNEWRHANIFPVFAAGNIDNDNRGGPGSIATPANYPESFAVGALDVGDDLANFSLRGPSPYDEIKPDISAPGQGIRSSIPGGGYAGNSGTSMAAPAVAGAIALLLQANSNLTVNEIEEILTSTAKPLTDHAYPDSPNNGYGYGLIDAENAVLAIEQGVATVEGNVVEEGTETPLQAEISVLGTKRSVKTDPEYGSYFLRYAAGEHVLRAESYGYYPVEKKVELDEDDITEIDFSMEKIPQTLITGEVVDARNGNPIEGAYVLLAEDANIAPVQTNGDGSYELTAHEGEYTLRISASGFKTKELAVTVSEDNHTFHVDMEPFFSYPGGELAYDDGDGEGGSWFLEAGNGWGVRMSLEDRKEKALVTEGKFLFAAGGGDQFQVAVMDANGPNGGPGNLIAGPYDATAVKDGGWTTVDLRDYGIFVEEEFYMVYIQSEGRETAPRLQNDKDEFTYRSWELYKDFWYPLEPNFLTGNKMIRAVVEYEIEEAIITSPEDGSLTNKAEVTVNGTAAPGTTIKLLQNGEEVGSADIDDDGNFAIEAELAEGKNEFVAVTYVSGEEASESNKVTVNLDTEAPELEIISPKDGERTNRETATIKGTVQDEHLDTVTINGKKIAVEDGAFSQRVLLQEGENIMEILATDLTGNETKETITIYADYTAPEILNVTPMEDRYVKTGQSVKIEFHSEPGLRASYVVHLPLTNLGVQTTNVTELPLMEITRGKYVGYYTVTDNVYAEGAVIEVKAVDEFGNETRKQAEGRLFINN
ncbi:S8 family serine peptidase [Oceanobacillus luteolus]|uniref:S8 family serine peptidase n=1 Tax=Oceanobacillus luteolus TaxID=1274358 RepID=A0ABW4HVK4_9BACI